MNKFKKLFTKYKIDGYIVPKNDEYFNEYVPEYKDRLKFISKFSGSAGFAIILKNKNYLFVDGRYTTQAFNQSGKKFKIVTIPRKFPKNVIKTHKEITIGFDPKLHTEQQLNFIFKIKNVKLKSLEKNLVDIVWSKKRKNNTDSYYSMPKHVVGNNAKNKILQVKKLLIKNKIDLLLVTAPENVAWILNIRGKDSFHSPIPNTRLLISRNGEVQFFADLKKINKLKENFKNKIKICSEIDIVKYFSKLSNKKIWLDRQSCPLYFKMILNKKNKVLEKMDPIYLFKSVKNNIEIKNMKKSHLIDGVALTKFLFWVKKNFKNKNITEISAQNKLESFRKMNSKYKYPSFSTISGSGPNSAIIHYKATTQTNRKLKKRDLYLIDSGGQYYFGTTDVTRTVSLDNNSNYIKNIYTRVLKGHIAVSNFKIKKNTTGSKIDKEARKYLNKIKLDYPHGTGHGVGYFLNVHEGPQSISKNSQIKLKEGMILSNEPGYYKNGSFGIRIENLVYIKKNKFIELTLAPIEKSLINKNILNKTEIKWLNDYHQKVMKNLYKFMGTKEKTDLIKACSPI
mgnify:CR=1 FL=1